MACSYRADRPNLLTRGRGALNTVRFSGVKVFSSTMANDREQLGERISAWLRAHPNLKIVDKIVLQSSDQAFHCLSVTLFYVEDGSD
jgi:hypothetical protein